jgi:hypothetical protein
LCASKESLRKTLRSEPSKTKIEQVNAKVGDFWLSSTNRTATTVQLGGRAGFSIKQLACF